GLLCRVTRDTAAPAASFDRNAGSINIAASRERHRSGKIRKRLELVRKRHRVHKMLLEFWFKRRLDLFDLPHHLFDLAAVAFVQKRHARAGARGIADTGDLVEG